MHVLQFLLTHPIVVQYLMRGIYGIKMQKIKRKNGRGLCQAVFTKQNKYITSKGKIKVPERFSVKKLQASIGMNSDQLSAEFSQIWPEDQAHSVNKFLNSINQRYAFNLIAKVSEEQRFQYVEAKNQQDGSIKLLLRKFN